MNDSNDHSDTTIEPSDDHPIEIRVLESPAELRRLMSLFSQVWGTVTPLVGVEMLRAMVHTGGYVAGAFSNDRIVGGSLGFLARHNGEIALHSHVTGVLPGVRHTGLGRLMKMHQRDWAARHDIDWVTWTFDPLVRRNAWFNIAVLGATVDSYLVDFYGQMTDSINSADPSSDRLVVAWPTAVDGDTEAPAEVAVDDESLRRVATPDDILVLRRTDPPAAIEWRRRMREELGGALDDGAEVVGFTRDGEYLLATR